MKCFSVRTLLLTFTLGIVSVPFVYSVRAKWTDSSIELPKTQSGSVINVTYPTRKNGLGRYMHKGSGGNGVTCKEFLDSLGELTEQSRRIFAHTPCGHLVSEE